MRCQYDGDHARGSHGAIMEGRACSLKLDFSQDFARSFAQNDIGRVSTVSRLSSDHSEAREFDWVVW
jgi:hypothetical protein